MSHSEEDFHPSRIVWMTLFTPADAGNTTSNTEGDGGQRK